MRYPVECWIVHPGGLRRRLNRAAARHSAKGRGQDAATNPYPTRSSPPISGIRETQKQTDRASRWCARAPSWRMPRLRWHHVRPRTRRFVMKELVAKSIKVFSLAAGVLSPCRPGPRTTPSRRKPTGWRGLPLHTGETLPRCACTTRRSARLRGAGARPARNGRIRLHPAHEGLRGRALRAGQPLDASRYFVILPDALGTGNRRDLPTACARAFQVQTTKTWCSRSIASSPRAFRSSTCGWFGQLDGRHADLDLGREIPESMDALVPMACQPTEMSGRNWMLRRLLVESIRSDPDWNGGSYTSQPKSMQRILVQFGIATSADRRRSTSRRTRARRAMRSSRSASRNPSARRQRRPVPVGILGRLQPFAGLERIRRARRHQRRRRRTQSARAGNPRARDQARQRRALCPHPRERGDARPWDYRQCRAMEATSRGSAAEGAENGKVAAAQSTSNSRCARGRGSVPSAQRVRCGMTRSSRVHPWRNPRPRCSGRAVSRSAPRPRTLKRSGAARRAVRKRGRPSKMMQSWTWRSWSSSWLEIVSGCASHRRRGGSVLSIGARLRPTRCRWPARVRVSQPRRAPAFPPASEDESTSPARCCVMVLPDWDGCRCHSEFRATPELSL